MKGIFLIITIVISSLTGCEFSKESKISEEPTLDASVDEMEVIEEVSIDHTNWISYQNNIYGFSITYPPDWKAWEDPSKTYPIQTTNTKYFDYVTLNLQVNLSNYPQRPSYRDTVYFAVVNFDLETFLVKIEGFGASSTGDSLTSVGEVKSVLINGAEAFKNTHANPNGMVTTFYYIPLIESEQSLFVYYQDMLTYERQSTVEEIIHYHLKLYAPLNEEFESAESSSQSGWLLYSKEEVQFYYPEEWKGRIVKDAVIENTHYQEIDFYDQEGQVKMSLLCPEWQGGIEVSVSSYSEQKNFSMSEGVVTLTFIIYDEEGLPGFAYLNLPVSLDGESCSLSFSNIEAQEDLDTIYSIHDSVAFLH